MEGDSKPPNLQELVARYGRWDLIPEDAWAEWDRANAEYQEQRRKVLIRELGQSRPSRPRIV